MAQSPADGHLSDDPLAFYNIAIVGGGACGLAVFTQLIERAKRGLKVHSVTVIERNDWVGPGLAYSEACWGASLNMPADAMGLSTDNRLHFYEWVAATHPGPTRATYLPRKQYGEYLANLMISTVKEAEQLGVVVRIVNDEAFDIHQTDQGFEVQLVNSGRIRAHHVVLAIGNFPGARHRELAGTPGYLPTPWPNSRLEEIPPDASVSVLGSRLTAVDTAIFLTENGHRGPINFISRSARLPKVQGKIIPFARRHALQSLVREIEESPEDAFSKIVTGVKDEMEKDMTIDWSSVGADHDPLTELRNDVADATRGSLPWQTILKSSGAFSERVWKCLTMEEKLNFVRGFSSTWVAYRVPMSLENGRKVLALMESGQLNVLKGEKVVWDGSDFVISLRDSEVRSQYLVEATGQETDAHQIESPLLQRLLGSGLLQSYPTGGVEVDFSTLAAPSGIHVLGELTSGVHYFTSSISFNIAHAARIADHLTGEPERRPLHVGLVVGDDVFSHLMLSKLVPLLIMQGHFPFVYQLQNRTDAKSKNFDLRELSFFENELLQDHVIPFLGTTVLPGAACLTVEQMESAYGVLVQRITSVNDSSFLPLLKSNHIDVGISLHDNLHLQKGVVRYFNSPRVLLNLHRGVLPSYKGVMTGFRAMMNQELDFGYSLHHLNRDSGAGDIVDIRTHPIDYRKPTLHWMEQNYGTGIAMLQDVIEKIARGKPISTIHPHSSSSRHYSVPTEEELAVARWGGIRLVDAAAIQEVILRAYAATGREDALQRVLRKATKDFYKSARAQKATNIGSGNDGAQMLSRL